MTSVTVTLASLIQSYINAGKSGSVFINNDFTVQRAYVPVTDISDIPENGQLFVVPLAGDDNITTRNKSFVSEIPIQLAYQKQITASNAQIELLIELLEQLRVRVTKAVDSAPAYAWLRNEALRDGTGQILHYSGLRDHSVFEAYFTAFYQIVTPGS